MTSYNNNKAKKLLENISAVYAIEIEGGFQIEIELKNGNREIIKNKSNSKPQMVQLFDHSKINGNFKGEGAGNFFKFSKSIESCYRDLHLKSYVVI